MDSSVKGYKSLLKKDPDQAKARAANIIKNTYRTLMTRGQKGCFVYSVDAETNEFLKAAAAKTPELIAMPAVQRYAGLPLRLVPEHEVQPYRNAVPVFDLQLAAGNFSEDQWAAPPDWVELPDAFVAKEGFFVSRVVGESMNRRIPNGSWCLFRASPLGSREGKTVLVQLRDRQDPENNGRYTVKVYHSTKRAGQDTWQHASITLKPDSTLPGFSSLVFGDDPEEELTVRGELVAVLGQRSGDL